MTDRDDHIEQLFRERLTGETTDVTWDTPSGNVWSGISRRLSGRKRRGVLLWIGAIGLIVVSGLVIGMLLMKENEATHEGSPAITRQPENEKPVEKALGLAPVTSINEAHIARSPEDENGRQQRHAPSSIASDRLEQLPSQGQESGKTPKLEIREHPGSVPEAKDSRKDATAQARAATGNLTQGGGKYERTAVSGATFLKTRPRFLEANLVNPFPAPIDLPATAPRDSRWGLEAFIAPARGGRRIHVAPDRPKLRKVLLEQAEEHALRFDAGVSMTYALTGRLALGLGFEYADYLLRSRYTRQIRYTRAGETVNDRGRLQNSYRVNLQTSYGVVATDVVVERSSGSVIAENAFITFEVPMRQSLQFVRMPLYLRYDLLDGRIPVFVRGGISLHYLASNDLRINTIVSSSPAIDRIRTVHDGAVKGARRLTVGYQAGVGAAIPLTDHFSVTGEAALNASAEPIYDHEDIRIFPVSTGFRLGVRYKW